MKSIGPIDKPNVQSRRQGRGVSPQRICYAVLYSVPKAFHFNHFINFLPTIKQGKVRSSYIRFVESFFKGVVFLEHLIPVDNRSYVV